ncbi:DUF4865 family protein [Rhizobium binxianense]
MIAMQYSFTLPADYDMAIIDRRIRDKGPMLDDFPDLKFKAYLSARRGKDGSRENLYAPFYVWENGIGLSNCLCGDGFQALTQSFGWPQVATWIVWNTRISGDVLQARYASRELLAAAPYSPLAELRQRESDEVMDDIASGGALASVSAFEPTNWTRVRFRLWRDLPRTSAGGTPRIYDVGHISLPKRQSEIT